jgi:hypothetical protein
VGSTNRKKTSGLFFLGGGGIILHTRIHGEAGSLVAGLVAFVAAPTKIYGRIYMLGPMFQWVV